MLQYIGTKRNRYIDARTSISFSVFLMLAHITINTFYSSTDRVQILNGDSESIPIAIYQEEKGTTQTKPTQSLQSRCAPGQEAKDPKSTIDYQITCVWPPGDIKPTRLVFGVINPKHINRDDLSKLAKHLEFQFSKYPGVNILLYDNIEDARFYGEGILDDFSGALKNLRVTYVLDQATPREYIEFIPDKTKPENKVKIDIK